MRQSDERLRQIGLDGRAPRRTLDTRHRVVALETDKAAAPHCIAHLLRIRLRRYDQLSKDRSDGALRSDLVSDECTGFRRRRQRRRCSTAR